MLHVVQVVLWGVAEKPLLYVHEEKARSAYAESVRRCWEQRYSAYCEHHGVSRESFDSAQAFVKTLDVSEKSAVNMWSVDAEDAGAGIPEKAVHGPGEEEIRRVAEGVVAVREGLARLLAEVSELTGTFALKDVSPAEVGTVAGSDKTALSSSAPLPEMREPDPQTYATQEWKIFVGTIKRMCTGSRNEFYLLHRDDWRQDVYSHRTSLEYWDWVADRIMRYKAQAEKAGYTVIEDPPASGCFKFRNPEGVRSDDACDSEWEAWCAAGLQVEADSRSAAG